MEQKKKILVVEDEKDIRELYTEILKNEGFEVHEAKDGEEAYLIMYEGGFDLILLDIMLPKMDGFEILEKLNKETLPKKPNRAIVVLTNLGEDLSIAKGLGYGVSGYMVKSDYTPDQIVKEVKRYLGA